MDREWMRERLEKYKTLLDKYIREESRAYDAPGPNADLLYSQLNAEMPTAREIVRLLDSGLVTDITLVNGASFARAAAEQALGALRDLDEWKTRLVSDAPSLVADRFHPNIWRAASPIWETGRYRVAAQQPSLCRRTSQPKPDRH
jgi:hypothetical protein